MINKWGGWEYCYLVSGGSDCNKTWYYAFPSPPPCDPFSVAPAATEGARQKREILSYYFDGESFHIVILPLLFVKEQQLGGLSDLAKFAVLI